MKECRYKRMSGPNLTIDAVITLTTKRTNLGGPFAKINLRPTDKRMQALRRHASTPNDVTQDFSFTRMHTGDR